MTTTWFLLRRYRTARTKPYDTVSHSAGAYLASATTAPDLRPRTSPIPARPLWCFYSTTGAEQLGEQARAGAIDASCEFTKNMLANLERAVDHPNMTEDLAEILSTPQVELEYEVRSEVRINGLD
jgi:hypothetical protein